MGEIITEWIASRTGIILDLSSTELVDYIKDGKILAQIIHSYGIIDNDTFQSIEKAETSSDACETFERIRAWLRPINIDFDDRLIKKIVNDNSNSSAVKLFYHLYLALNDKDKVHFIVQRFSNKVNPPPSRFTVEKEEEIPQGDVKEKICSEFVKQQDVIEWQKFKYKYMLEKFKEAREKYLLHLQKLVDKENLEVVSKIPVSTKDKDDMVEIKKLPIKPPKNSTFGELIEEVRHFEQSPPLMVDSRKSKVYINTIREKRRHRERQKQFQIQMQKVLLQELWERIISSQEEELNESLRSVLTKQAKYERQMAMKLMDVREEKAQIIQHKIKSQNKIQRKLESEMTYSGFIEEKQSDDLIRSYYEEKARMLELHRYLFALRQCLKKERNWNICKDIVKDLTDIAIRYGEYREIYETDVPPEMKSDMAQLFIKEQPIFDILEQADDVLQDYFSDEPAEAIHTYETIRVGYLDKNDFQHYLDLRWPWSLENLYLNYENELGNYNEMLKKIELGMNVLGHIVHWLVKAKCNPPKVVLPPDIIKARPAACVTGITNPETTVPILQRILQQRKIKVIEMQEVINYCMAAYKEEATEDLLEDTLADETLLAIEQKNGKPINTKKKGEKKTKSNAKKDKNKEKLIEVDDIIPELPVSKTVGQQTPRSFPCERLVLTRKAELGLIAHEMLSLGDPISEKILVDMTVEYLKTLRDITGWVIINFPIDFTEAAALEEGLTAIPVPRKNIADPSEKSDELDDFATLVWRIPLEKVCSEKWKSQIVDKPAYIIEEPFYETYLTAFIKITQDDGEQKEVEVNPEDSFDEEEGMSNIEVFYAKQGCFYTMTYKILDFSTLKHLARLIVGDFTLPPKASIEIFGDTVLYIEEELKASVQAEKEKPKSKQKGKKERKPKKIEKKSPPKEEKTKNEEKGKKGKKEEKDKKDKGKKDKGKGNKPDAVITAVSMEDKEVQVPEEESDVIVIYEEPPPPPKPGELEWCYVTIDFPQKLKVALATLWINAEEVYVDDFQQLFFFQRIILNTAWPYLNYVRHYMRNFLARPDQKQDYLFKFQQRFNEFAQDMREDDEVKFELHCLIGEFRDKMLLICDNRMLEAEEERRKFMTNYWEGMEMCELGNVYINMLQLEANRCADTLLLVTDYYTAMITKVPYEDPFPEKWILEKIEIGNLDMPSEIVCELYNFILKDFDVSKVNLSNPIFHFIEQNWMVASDYIKKYEAYAQAALTKASGYFKKKDKDKSKNKGKDKEKIKENTRPAKGGGGGGKLPKITEPDEEVKDVSDRILEEWAAIIDAETTRVNFRLHLIVEAAKKKIGSYLQNSTNFYLGLYDEIIERYNKEVDSVEKACQLFARAVEAEIPIQPLLLFKGDKFHVDPNSNLFPDPLPEPDPPLVEREYATIMKLSQINQLVNILFDIAPSGIIPERTFLYILMDAICLDAEDGRESLVPPNWKKLQPQQVEQMTKQIFGYSEFVNWKDFIILSLDVAFPTEEELVKARSQFRINDPDETECVKDYQYFNITLWFEESVDPEDCQDLLRLGKIKALIFRLYKINEDTINYTAMLLAFCKDACPVLGIAKGLYLSLGKRVCWDLQTGNRYLQYWEQKRRAEEEEYLKRKMELQEATEAAEGVIDDLVDHTVHICDSLVIEEVPSRSAEIVDEALNGNEELHEGGEDENTICTLSKCSSIFWKEFSNIEIGYEEFDLPQLAYFLPFELIMTLMTAALPWYAKVQNLGTESLSQKIKIVFESLKREEFNFSVLTHEFLNCDEFYRLLPSISNQFTVLRPETIVESFLNEM